MVYNEFTKPIMESKCSCNLMVYPIQIICVNQLRILPALKKQPLPKYVASLNTLGVLNI